MNEIRIEKSGNVYWISEKHRRNIGKLVNDTFYCQRRPEHFHRLTKSYGFNYELVKYSPFIFICVELQSGEKIWTTRQTVLEKGKVLNFKKQGFELQIFLKLEHFRNTKELSIPPIPPVLPVKHTVEQLSLV